MIILAAGGEEVYMTMAVGEHIGVGVRRESYKEWSKMKFPAPPLPKKRKLLNNTL